MKIISIRENPEYKEQAIRYIQSKWTSVSPIIYEDCIHHSIGASNPLPQWYLLEKNGDIIGCAGLITNDFISRMDLYPWVCALHVNREHRGNAYGALLLEKAKWDCMQAGFEQMYLATDFEDFYEKYGFRHIGQGYHPWEESSRIYVQEFPRKQEKATFSIRQENESDYNNIYRLIQTAFVTAKVKDGTEQDFAVNLRNSANYIPELALVAESEGALIGHIMLTTTSVSKPDGSIFKALLLAPVSVMLEYRNIGIGSALIRKGFEIAKTLGHSAIFLCGDPGYYNRFGFSQASLQGIKSGMGIPEQFVLVVELEPNALGGVTGTVNCC